jgi:DNA modification methylase
MLIQSLQGDCREILKTLPDNSVNCCVTSPPYFGLRDYGADGQIGLENTVGEYVGALVEVFKEVKRVLRTDGTCWLNLGDSYIGYKGEKLNNTGKRGTGEFSPIPKGRPGLMPATPQSEGLGQKQLIGVPWRVAFALQDDGWWLRSEIIWHKPNAMPESVTDRPTKAHEQIFLLTKSSKYYYDADTIREKTGKETALEDYSDIKAKGSWVSGGLEYYAGQNKTQPRVTHPLGRNKRSVWTVASQPYSGSHFATFPEKLIEPCILAGCPAGGTVLDPFGGSGTTGRVAVKHGRNAILIELNPEYHKLIDERTDKVQVKMAI